jgi:hypothetical protein
MAEAKGLAEVTAAFWDISERCEVLPVGQGEAAAHLTQLDQGEYQDVSFSFFFFSSLFGA